MKLAALLVAGCSSGYEIEVEATPDRLSIDGAPCVTGVRLERDGEIVDQVVIEPDRTPSFETMPAGTDVVLSGCGPDARVPIPAILPAVPTITAWSGGHVEWTESPPVDQISLRVYHDEGLTIYLVDPSLGAYDVADGYLIQVGAHLTATTVATPIGDAHVQPSAYATASTLDTGN